MHLGPADGNGPGEWNAGESVAANAARALPVLAAGWLAKGQAAISQNGSQNGDFRALHRFRLRTKSFRYTLELFEAIYGEDMKKGLRTVQALQTRLGRINDFVITLDLAKGHRAVEEALKRARDAEVEQLGRFWKRHFDAPSIAWWSSWLAT